jgi:uncharacterized protein
VTAPLGGLRAVTPARRREIAALGGRAAHAAGVAHCFTREEARAAGKLGGAVVAARPGHMAALSRLGDDSRRHAALAKTPRRKHVRNPVRLVIVPDGKRMRLELRRGSKVLDVMGELGGGVWDLTAAGCKADTLARVLPAVAARQGLPMGGHWT